MNPAQKLYDLKSSIIDSNSKILETEYFRIIDNIRARPNLYKIAPEKINLKRNAYEPFKDPDVIKYNRKLLEEKITELKNKGYNDNILDKGKIKLDEIFSILIKKKIFN